MIDDSSRLLGLCAKGYTDKGLTTDYARRLKEELKAIEEQEDHAYFLDLYDRKVRYPYNQNNLIVPWLLGIVPDFDIDKPPIEFMGEMPDCDVDFIKPVQEYLKNTWAQEKFGKEFVCSIGTYTTFGLKLGFQSMAKVFGKDHAEITALTKKLKLKDEDGKGLTFDRAMIEYPPLKEYCDRNPDVADAVKHCLNRNRAMGKHAGGLIISSQRIDDLVPLTKDKEGNAVSAWTEGQGSQDLGPMGLIKFDVLVTTCLLQNAHCLKLIRERYGIKHICSDPAVNRDWSDSSYIDDPKSLAMANEGDLLAIFQFDSFDIRKLCKGNVTSFNDLMAYNALWRPGAILCQAPELYVKRKNGEEPYEIHPLLEPILGPTYGTVPYQEQVLEILALVGKIPPKDCLVALKGISKKKVEKIQKYKSIFVKNGQETLGYSEDRVVKFFADIESSGSYSFNKSHSCAYAYLAMRCLYLKSHYPIEFFTSTLQCEKDTEKLKDYIIDARKRGLRVESVNLNKSKDIFSINTLGDTEVIFYGFNQVKGIGKEVAKRIVANQPYSDFEDFLIRFGTDLKVVAPLVSLNAFGEDNHKELFQFYERYKKWVKSYADRQKRHDVSKEKHLQKLYEALQSLYPAGSKFDVDFSESQFEIYRSQFDAQQTKSLEKLRTTYLKFLETHRSKVENDKAPSMSDLQDPDEGLDERWQKVLDTPRERLEVQYYGFRWVHPLEMSPDCVDGDRKTFQTHKVEIEEGKKCAYVEVEIEEVEKVPFNAFVIAKKAFEEKSKILEPGSVELMTLEADMNAKEGYRHVLTVSDVLGDVKDVTVFADDFKIFEEMLVPGNLVKMTLGPEHPQHANYTFFGYPKYMKHRAPKKESDFRVVKLRKSSEENL